jgi:hypothetical protein
MLSVILEIASEGVNKRLKRRQLSKCARVICSWEPVLGLLRGLPLSERLPDVCLASLSSGGSESGLEVLLSGLDGGLLLSSP